MNTEKFNGSADKTITEREKSNAAIARRAAAEGMVLLENNGVLPIKKGQKLALYGCGARHTVKGGTGSGDVNDRGAVSIYDGLKEAGIEITSEKWLDDFDEIYENAREDWKNKLIATGDLGGAYCSTPFIYPAGKLLDEADLKQADSDTAMYIICRRSGEFVDRYEAKGDWYLDDNDDALIRQLDENFKNVIIVVNAGGLIDLSFLDKMKHLSALMCISQPGMEGGNAFADIATGAVAPSGKMTDTWAYKYSDYPSSEHFSHNDGDVTKAYYNDGIYVGYRYFDSFGIKPRYEFGYGLSYTEFGIDFVGAKINGCEVSAEFNVKNIGKTSGKEVVQLYAVLPNGTIDKEYKRLVAYAKTKLLESGEAETVTLKFDFTDCSSYYSDEGCKKLDAGAYVFLCGSSSLKNKAAFAIKLDKAAVAEKFVHICPLNEQLSEIRPSIVHALSNNELYTIEISADQISCKEYDYSKRHTASDEAKTLAKQLSDYELCMAMVGKPSGEVGIVGKCESQIPGAAGETSPIMEKLGLEAAVTADGPAGIRLEQCYQVKPSGDIVMSEFVHMIERGYFAPPHDPANSLHYQFCTAFPVCTCMAQTWNEDIIYEVGAAVAREMDEFGVTLWLAPGMNIHRNPLCGRNYEYYSEDPLVSGITAAAVTKGVQSVRGCGTTIKHFACNNQEDNRQYCDSVVSERSLRELYLRGFEIAVKRSQPMSLMTSYNLINGLHAANHRDLITDVLRCEWGFKGLVMSDWWSTGTGGASNRECAVSGNDLIMPGMKSDADEIYKALGDGKISRDMLEECAARVIEISLIKRDK